MGKAIVLFAWVAGLTPFEIRKALILEIEFGEFFKKQTDKSADKYIAVCF
jgi:hypothetical protein